MLIDALQGMMDNVETQLMCPEAMEQIAQHPPEDIPLPGGKPTRFADLELLRQKTLCLNDMHDQPVVEPEPTIEPTDQDTPESFQEGSIPLSGLESPKDDRPQEPHDLEVPPEPPIPENPEAPTAAPAPVVEPLEIGTHEPAKSEEASFLSNSNRL